MSIGPRDKPYPLVTHIDSVTGKPVKLAEASAIYVSSVSSVSISATNVLASSVTGTNYYVGSAIQFNTTPTSTLAIGQIAWNPTDQTLDIQTSVNTTLQVGQEQVMLIENKSGAAINNGKVVYVSGTTGGSGKLNIGLASASATNIKNVHCLGVMTQTVANNNMGFATTFGKINGIPLPTASFSDGDIAYLSDTPGELSRNRPSKPSHSYFQIGRVIRAHDTNGILFVNIRSSLDMDEIHDVASSIPYDGQVLVWNNASAMYIPNNVSAISGINNYALTASLASYETTSYARNTYATTASLSNYITTGNGRFSSVTGTNFSAINISATNVTGVAGSFSSVSSNIFYLNGGKKNWIYYGDPTNGSISQTGGTSGLWFSSNAVFTGDPANGSGTLFVQRVAIDINGLTLGQFIENVGATSIPPLDDRPPKFNPSLSTRYRVAYVGPSGNLGNTSTTYFANTDSPLDTLVTPNLSSINDIVANINLHVLNGNAYIKTISATTYQNLPSVTGLAGTGVFATTASLASYETTAYARNTYATTASLASYALTASLASYETTAYARNTYETTGYARNTYATTASLQSYATTASLDSYETTAYAKNNYVLTSVNTNLSSAFNNHLTSAVHWDLNTLNSNYINASGDSANANFYFSSLSGATISATTYFNLPLGGYATTASLASYALTASLASYETTAYARNNYATTASLASYALTASLASYETTSYARNTYATTASLASYETTGYARNNYVLTSVNTNLSSAFNNHIASAVHWDLNTLNTNYINTSGDSASAGFYFSSLSGTTVSATNYLNLPLGGYATTAQLQGYETTAYARNTYALTASLASYETTAYARNTYATTASLASYALTASLASYETTGYARNNYVLTSVNTNLSSAFNNHLTSAVHWDLTTLNTNYINASGDSASAGFYFSSLSGTTVSATTYLNLPTSALSALNDVSSPLNPINGQVLTWSSTKWIASSVVAAGGGGGTPGGSNTQVQFNNNGSFSGSPGMTYDSSTSSLTITSVSATNYYNINASIVPNYFGVLHAMVRGLISP
jgi:hypothetical protein